MPNETEVAEIRKKFGSLYKIDVANLNSQKVKIEGLANSTTPLNATEVYSNSIHKAVGQVVPDLETFVYSDIAADNSIRTRLVEQNLEDAFRLLQSCSSLRREYSDVAKLYVDTSIKSEEFFRLDDIHLLEVAHGLYRLPYQEAADDTAAIKEALKEAGKQKKVVTDILGAEPAGAATPIYYAKLAETAVKTNADHANKGAAWTTVHGGNPQAGNIGNVTQYQAEYHSAIERASWEYSESAINGSIAELKGKLEISERKSEYLKKDESFRISRASVSRQLAYVQLNENTRPNAVLNYHDRLESIRQLFELSARKLCARVFALQQGARELYGIDLTFAAPSKGTLVDEAAKWLTELNDRVTKHRRLERVSIFKISLRRWMESHGLDFKAARANTGGFKVTFAIQPTDTSSVTGLIRGAAFEYVGKNIRPIQLVVTPPSSAVSNLSGPDVSTTLHFGRTMPVAASLDIKPQHVEAMWNGSPYGSWSIDAGRQLAEVGAEDCIFYLWMAY